MPTTLGLMHLGSHGSVVLIIFEALLLPALINAARQWPLTKNSNGQCRGDAALPNKSTGAPGWRPLQINIPSRRLGCAFHVYSGSGPASFFGILRFPRITSDSAEHTSELNHSRARLSFPESFGTRNPTGIRREGPLKVLHTVPRVTNIELAD